MESDINCFCLCVAAIQSNLDAQSGVVPLEVTALATASGNVIIVVVIIRLAKIKSHFNEL